MSSGAGHNIEDEVIIVGDKVDIVTQSGEVYRTMIEDQFDNGPFLAGIPNKKGVYMFVHQDDDLYLVFYRDTGRYIAQMKVVAIENRGELRYMWLLQKTRAQKNQRREAYRLPVDFDVNILEYMEERDKKGLIYVGGEAEVTVLESVSSRDISVTGIALLTRRQYQLNDKYLLSLHMDRNAASIRTRSSLEKSPALHLTASVRRCVPWRTGNLFNTGMEFFGMTESMSDGIAKYVLSEQQKQIKRRRRLI